MLLDAIVLAGGRSSRLGGEPKALLTAGGRSLVSLTVDAAIAVGARRVVVVGPDVGEPAGIPAGVLSAREVPAFGGPAAGIAAGLAALAPTAPAAPTGAGGSASSGDSVGVVVLACDMPGVAEAVVAVVAEFVRLVGSGTGPDGTEPGGTFDGVAAVDQEGRRQQLLAVYRAGALEAAVERHRAAGDLDGLAVRALLDRLNLREIAIPRGSGEDVDTWADAARLGVHRPAVGNDGGDTGGGDTDVDVHDGDNDDGGDTDVNGNDGAGKSDPKRQGALMSDDGRLERELGEWAARVAAASGADGFGIDTGAVLGVAGTAAHAVTRPAAPITTYVVGFAAGRAAARGDDPVEAAAEAIAVVERLAAEHAAVPTADPDGDPTTNPDSPDR